MIRFGRRLHDDTGGAFDLTVKPLVNLWGFGAAEPRVDLPGEAEIDAARDRLGSDRIEISEDGDAYQKRRVTSPSTSMRSLRAMLRT